VKEGDLPVEETESIVGCVENSVDEELRIKEKILSEMMI